MGRKRVNLIKLFKKTKLEKRNPDDEFLMPDKEYNLYLMGDWVIQIWEYKWEDYIGLIFRFRDFWSNEVKVSKHKRVCYKRIFYATPLYEIREDQKMMSPTRTMTEIVSGERLKEKGCL